MIIFGGTTGYSIPEIYSNNTYIFNFSESHFRKLSCFGKLPEYRVGSSTFVICNRLFVLFGRVKIHDDHHYYNNTYVLNITNKRWEEIILDDNIIAKAAVPIKRMLEISAKLGL